MAKFFNVKRVDDAPRIMFIGAFRLDLGDNIATEDEVKAIKANKGFKRLGDVVEVSELKDLDKESATKLVSGIEMITARRRAEEVLYDVLNPEEDDSENGETPISEMKTQELKDYAKEAFEIEDLDEAVKEKLSIDKATNDDRKKFLTDLKAEKANA